MLQAKAGKSINRPGGPGKPNITAKELILPVRSAPIEHSFRPSDRTNGGHAPILNHFKKLTNMMRYSCFLFVFVVSLCFSSCQDEVNTSEPGSLRTLATLPIASPLFLVKLNNNLYAGTGNGLSLNFLTKLWQYDFTSNSWQAKADFPAKLADGLSFFTVNEKLYVGFSTTGSINSAANNQEEYSKDFYEYDPTANTWKTVALTSSRLSAGATSLTYQGKGLALWGVYRTPASLSTMLNSDGVSYDAVNGFNKVNITISGTSTFPINPANSFQTQRAIFEVTRVNGFGFSLNNRIYTGGGRTYSTSTFDPFNDNTLRNDVTAHGIYEFASTTNSDGLNLAVTNKFQAPSIDFDLTAAHQSFSLNDKGYVITADGQVISFNPSSNQWQKLAVLSSTAIVGTDLNTKAYFVNKLNQLLEYAPN